MSLDPPNEPNDFVAGDVRVEVHAALLSTHVLWLREHNRIASKISEALKDKLNHLSVKEKDDLIFEVRENSC